MKYDGRFPGQRFDQTTGLIQNGYRTYSTTLGRYLQSDPLGLAAGWNTYAYVGGNPVGGVDPLGLEVYLAFHRVLDSADIYHGKIVIKPKNLEYWRSVGVVNNKGTIIFGGGPDGIFSVLGDLRGGVNRDKDVLKGNHYRVRLTWSDCSVDEDEIIRRLLMATNRYNGVSDKSAGSLGYPYELFPDMKPLSSWGAYNSNSYVHGLGLAVGLRMPKLDEDVTAPGYNKPVPVGAFK